MASFPVTEKTATPIKIGILNGSTRPNGNGKGLESWLRQQLEKAEFTTSNGYEVVHVYPNAPMHPLGPVSEELIPAVVAHKGIAYQNEKTAQWSQLVASCHAFIILTPQHNWGYPGDLKNALDHLYAEWSNKSVLVITYGGHGGDKCGPQLKQVLTCFKMKVIEGKIEITLPSEYIRTDSTRLQATVAGADDSATATTEFPAWVTAAEESLRSGLAKLKEQL
jgi:NAD(P)H-dependent FMN reductase